MIGGGERRFNSFGGRKNDIMASTRRGWERRSSFGDRASFVGAAFCPPQSIRFCTGY